MIRLNIQRDERDILGLQEDEERERQEREERARELRKQEEEEREEREQERRQLIDILVCTPPPPLTFVV